MRDAEHCTALLGAMSENGYVVERVH
jgi:hypothetical protein